MTQKGQPRVVSAKNEPSEELLACLELRHSLAAAEVGPL